jgi:flagellar motor switch protein FliM
MSEYLTQSGIDQLFAGPGALAVAPTQEDHRPYSFRRPPRISNDRLLVLETILSRFAQGLQSLLVFRLHQQLTVRLVTIEQVIFSEFLLSLPSPCSAFGFRLRSGEQESGVLDLGTPLSLYCVDRMLGGSIAPAGVERRLTRLEQGIVKRVGGFVVAQLAEALAEYSQLSPELLAFESNADSIEAMQPDEYVYAFILEVEAEGFQGQMSLAVPLETLEEITGKPTTSDAPGERVPTREQVQLEQGIRSTQIDVAIRLPLVSLDARQIAELKAGDLIDTGHRSDVAFEVHLNGRPTFTGALGQVQRRLGLRIGNRVTDADGGRWVLGKKGRIL